MNYFGMFFSFMIPGIILGIIAAAGIFESVKRNRRKQAAKRQDAQRRIYELAVRRAEAEVHSGKTLYIAELGRETAPAKRRAA